jgi:hypothetical protein
MRGCHLCGRGLPALLPRTDAIGDPFKEVLRAYNRFDAGEPHWFSDAIAHARKGEGDSLILEMPN